MSEPGAIATGFLGLMNERYGMADDVEIDSEEWDAAWDQMEVRDFPTATATDLNEWFGNDFGQPLSGTIKVVLDFETI